MRKIYFTLLTVLLTMLAARADVYINSTTFPDANFRNYMLSLYPSGYMTTAQVNSLTTLNLSYKGISNMTGIEKLTALETLYCYYNSFTTLNLNSNTKLTYLDCAPNTQLLDLDIRYCTNLETLICYETGITDLNLGRLSKLKVLNCRNTKLTYLDVRERPQLTRVDCSNCTSLTHLDISDNSALTILYANGCTALTWLTCESNALSTLNVTGNTALAWLFCASNSSLSTITGLADCTAITRLQCGNCALTDLSACDNMTNLYELWCYKNKITELRLTHKSQLDNVDASNNPNLTEAIIYDNDALTDLDIKNCTALIELGCYDNDLTTLDVTGNTSLEILYCNDNDNLSSITGLANCAALRDFRCWGCAITNLSALNSLNNLEKVECYSNKITSLTLTNKSKLKEVDANFNMSLTTVTITGNSALTKLHLWICPALTTLNCYNNALTYLNVGWEEGEDMALKTLKCYNNPDLSSIMGLEECTALQKLYCYNCALTDLSAVNSMTNLDYLACYGNQLTSLTVTGKSKLTNLYCYNNPKMTTLTVANNSALKVLDIKNNTAMTTANCYNNALTTLTVTGNTALKSLYCYNNQLTSLNVQGCNALATIYCYKNKISGSGMTTLVNTLPTRTASSPGTMRAIYNSNENNSMTAAQITTARGKHWNPKKYNGSAWVDMTGIEDKIWMNNGEGDPGQYVNIPVYLQNSEPVSAMEFDLYYPQGFTASVTKGERLTDECTVTNTTASGGHRHVVIANYSTNVIVEEAGSGILGYVKVKIPATASGQYEVSLRNISVVLESGTKTLSDCYASLTVGSSRGDVNGDGNVNISDVTALIDYLLSGNASGINLDAADCNQSGVINISDVTALIDYLLSGSW